MHLCLRQRSSSSGYRGVRKNGLRRYATNVQIGGVNVYLGTYKTGAEAALVYDDYIALHFGPDECLRNGVTLQDIEIARAKMQDDIARERRLAASLAHFATQIRARRLSHGMTQKQLAAELGVNHTMISRWERGKRPLPEKYVVPLTLCLGDGAWMNF